MVYKKNEGNDFVAYSKEDMNRTFPGMYIEWWLHNLGYYITLPFTKLSKKIKWYNTRLRDVDLESHKESENNA